MRRAAWASIIACVTCAAASSIAVFNMVGSLPASPASTEPWNLAFRPHPGTRLPLATSVVDEAGRAITLADFFSKSPVIVVLEYLRCKSLCGMTLRNLVLDALKPLPLVPGRDYQLLAISIDPRDKPVDAAAARAKYVQLFDASRATASIF